MPDQLQKCTVRYKIADYPVEEETVYCNACDDYEQVIQKAKAQVSRRCGGSLPSGPSRFWSVSREDSKDERFLTKNISQ